MSFFSSSPKKRYASTSGSRPFLNQDIPVLPVHDSFIIIRGLYSELVNVMHDEFEKMFGVPINIYDSAKASLVSFAPEDVDVD